MSQRGPISGRAGHEDAATHRLLVSVLRHYRVVASGADDIQRAFRQDAGGNIVANISGGESGIGAARLLHLEHEGYG